MVTSNGAASASTTTPVSTTRGASLDTSVTTSISGPAPAPRRRGRPMSEDASEAIHAATAALLAEVGVDGFTLRDVVVRAGVGLATIYRRWPTKHDLVVDTITRIMHETVAQPSSQSPTKSVRELVRRHVVLMRDTPAGAAMPAIIAEASRSSSAVAGTLQGWLAHRRTVIRESLRAGVESGEFRADLDLDVAIDLLAGPVWYRMLVLGERLTDEQADRLADEFLRWAAPLPAPGGDSPTTTGSADHPDA